MQFAKLGALAGAIVVVAAACSSGGTASPSAAAPASAAASTAPASGAPSGSPAASKGTLKIGIELPMSGSESANGVPTANGVKLLVKEVNAAGGVGGYTLDVNQQDDAVNGVHDPTQGATNMKTLVADAAVIGEVGPFNSNVAKAEIPVSNQAGLPMCSPANTNNGVTQPPEGDKYRQANPTKISYIRTATPDSIQGPSMADYMYNDLKVTSVYIIDDTETFGVGVGDTFEAEFKKLGGTVVKRDSAPKSTTDYTPLFTAVAGQKPAGVYLAGTTPTGMGLALKQGRTVAGFETVPFGGPDGVADLGPAGTEGATITVAGAAAANVYGTVGAVHDCQGRRSTPTTPPSTARLRAPTAPWPTPALRSSWPASRRPSTPAQRTTPPFARASAPTPRNSANTFDTVSGQFSFDKNGDNTHPYMSFYKTDMTLTGGKGGWIFVKQQAFTDPNAQ